MGNNTKVFDKDAYYNNMTTKELYACLDKAVKFLKEHHSNMVREHEAYLRMKIAERIGVKNGNK